MAPTDSPAEGSHDWIEAQVAGRHYSVTTIAHHFAYSYLKPNLRLIGAGFAAVAFDMISRLPDGPQLTEGLCNLVGVRDHFIRAAMEAERQGGDDG
ncbi:hypothetical protein [Polymorphospora lycopeni]|uniref:Uncharacterized protein n=1 Tax=Polymorphospora lycopeni TaxID=3140240 RepID=A0ABV5CKU6_9ACTN